MTTMKAFVYHQYGSPEVMEQREVKKPVPKDNEVLVQVHASSINSWDWDLVTGKPLVYRLLSGLFKPKYPIIGSDIAGTTEAVGKGVNSFKAGDAVFGDISAYGFGAFAEYVCVPEVTLAVKPDSITFTQAASIPQAGLLALQGLRDCGKIQSGQKVLINGAGGGVGSFAIQLAKYYGAEVTGVDRTEKLETMQTLGADHVIDYFKEDFTKNGQTYDLILDVTASHAYSAIKRALKNNGIYVIIGGSISRMISVLVLGNTLSRHQKFKILAHKPNRADLETMVDLIEKGEILPFIHRIYPLEEVQQAIQHLGQGLARGKIVIKMESNHESIGI